MITVYIKNTLITPTDCTYTSTDPGGFETFSMKLPSGFLASPGDEVRIFEGSDTVWHGRVEDPGKTLEYGAESDVVNGVGYGVELKDNTFQMVYVDSDISGITGSTTTRKITLLNGTFTFAYTPVDPITDISSGFPSLTAQIEDSWVSPIIPIVEGNWDSGFGNTFGEFYAEWSTGPRVFDATWLYAWFFCSQDTTNVADSTGDLITSGAAVVNSVIHVVASAASGDRRCLGFQFYYAATPAGSPGDKYNIYTVNLSAYGSHGLTVHTIPGATVDTALTPRGLYLTDIVKDILGRSRTNFSLDISPNNFLVRQSAYRTPTDFESAISDLSKFVGWHWGVWEPQSFASSTPSFLFKPPPATTKKSCFLSRCSQIDITQSFSGMHDHIIVEYVDALSKTATVEYIQKHPGLKSSESHTLTLSMGPGTADSAAIFARYALTLDQTGTRISGTATLPLTFDDGSFTHLLKPGRDKFRIPDFPFATTILDRGDTFRVKRVSVTVTNGVPQTQVEFDQGADLIEVLQARLSQGNATIGF